MNHRSIHAPFLILGLAAVLALAGCRGPSDPGPEVTAPIAQLSQADLENIRDIQLAYVGLLFAVSVDPELRAQLDATGTVTLTPADFDVTEPTASGRIVLTKRTLTVDGLPVQAVEMNADAAGDATGNIDTPDADPYIAGSTDDDDAAYPDISVIRGTVVITENAPAVSVSTYGFDVKTVTASAGAEETTTGTVTVDGTAYSAAEVETALDQYPSSRSGRSFRLPGSSLSIEGGRPES